MLLVFAGTAFVLLSIHWASVLYLVIAIATFGCSLFLVLSVVATMRRRLVCPKCGEYWGPLLEGNLLTIGYKLSEQAELCPDCGYKLDEELP